MKYLAYTLLFFVIFAVAFGLFLNASFAQNNQENTSPGSGQDDTAPGSGQDDTSNGEEITLDNPAGSETVQGLVDNIINKLITIATPIVAIMILIGAFQILFAAGDPEKFKRGKKTILYTVIGYAIILVASGITSIIKSVLTGG